MKRLIFISFILFVAYLPGAPAPTGPAKPVPPPDVDAGSYDMEWYGDPWTMILEAGGRYAAASKLEFWEGCWTWDKKTREFKVTEWEVGKPATLIKWGSTLDNIFISTAGTKIKLRKYGREKVADGL